MNRALLITSHKKNTRAREHLFESLEKCQGIAALDVIVVIGGYDKYTLSTEGRVTTVQAPHNSIDFTGLLAILDNEDLLRHDSYFSIHDTTRPGPAFVEHLLNIPSHHCSASFQFPSMNMGLYSHDVLKRSRALLETFRNTSEDPEIVQRLKKRCVEMEDCLFRSNLEGHVFLSSTPPVIDGAVREYYGSGIPRLVEYYPDMDLYKIKANWYVKPTYQLAL